jgi:hypothetical protein
MRSWFGEKSLTSSFVIVRILRTASPIEVPGASPSQQCGPRPRIVCDTARHERFQKFETLLGRKHQELGVFDVFESEAARAAAGLVVAAQFIFRAPLYETSPEQLKLFIELACNARGAPARAIVGDADLGRMLDDAARVEMRELHRDSPDEIPCAPSAREKFGHLISERVGRFVGCFRKGIVARLTVKINNFLNVLEDF